MSTPRLQAMVDREGIHDCFVWGNGRVGSILFGFDFPCDASQTIRPNQVVFSWPDGELAVTALQDRPGFLVAWQGIRGASFRCRPARREYAGLDGGIRRSAAPSVLTYSLPQGCLWLAGQDLRFEGDRVIGSGRSGWLLAGAATEKEMARGGSFPDLVSILRPTEEHLEWLRTRLTVSDPVLGSLFVHALHAAVASIKHDENGRFAGLAAGYGYALPSRTYFRDGYWTAQALLPFRPDIVRQEILLLARGVRPDGECPSGVILATPIGTRHWEHLRASRPDLARDHRAPAEWWSDHFDSPLFFTLMSLEYIRWTGDAGILYVEVEGRTIAAIVRTIMNRYLALCGEGALPLKPRHDRDWADNVFRSGAVTYDIALFHGALKMAVEIDAAPGPAAGWAGGEAGSWRAFLPRVRAAASATLWRRERGYYLEFADSAGVTEDHLAIDTLTAIRYHLAGEEQARRLLANLRSTLQTRHNRAQPYGDWGVMCAFPAYRRRSLLRGKTLFAYRYHNGSDWPYWDGVYAQILLERRYPDWRYVLTRWWEYSLERGWPEPVEYHSPAWGRGSPLQGWSSTAAAAMVTGGFGIGPGRKRSAPLWGTSLLHGIHLEGRVFDAEA